VSSLTGTAAAAGPGRREAAIDPTAAAWLSWPSGVGEELRPQWAASRRKLPDSHDARALHCFNDKLRKMMHICGNKQTRLANCKGRCTTIYCVFSVTEFTQNPEIKINTLASEEKLEQGKIKKKKNLITCNIYLKEKFFAPIFLRYNNRTEVQLI
jgi:hypothetical protein